MKFYESFVQAANELGWSQNYISKEFDINRGILYKIYNGEATLPLNKFRKILDKMVLPASEIKTLCNQYYKEFYGADEFARIKYIEKMLSKLAEPIHFSHNNKKERFILNDDIAHLSSKSEIINAVNYLFDSVEDGEVITNYPYSYRCIDDVLFEKLASDSKFSVLHMVIFDKENNGIKNLENIFCSIRWLTHQINPICQFSYTNLLDSMPYPYFIGINNYCLLFNSNQDKGVLLKSDEMFSQIKETSAKFVEKGFPLAFIPKDMLDMKNGVSRANTDKVEWCMSAYPCLSPIADKDFIYSIIRKDVPNIDFLAQIAIEHYNGGINTTEEKFILSASGLREFAETGKVKEIPAMFITEAPKAERIRYFNHLSEIIDKGKLYILDDSSFKLPKTFIMDFFTNIFQIDGEFCNVPDELKHFGNFLINISDKSIQKDFFDFVEYMRDNNCFYPVNAAKSFLNSLIVYCEKIK